MESVILIQWLESSGLGRWFVGLVQVPEIDTRVSKGSLVGQMPVSGLAQMNHSVRWNVRVTANTTVETQRHIVL